METKQDIKHYNYDLLVDFVDGILGRDAKRKIKLHLEQCTEWSQIVLGIRHYYQTQGDNREKFDNYMATSEAQILETIFAPQPEKAGILASIDKALNPERLLNYTMEQLKEFFKPVEHYERMIMSVARSTNIQPIKPVSGQQFDQSITFRLKQPAEENRVKVQIEDNRENKMLIAIFPPNTTDMVVDLDKDKFHPGRYYWKIKSRDGLAIGMFFVQKEMEPND